MKRFSVALSVFLTGTLLSLNAQTNDFYGDAPTNKLAGKSSILVTGEVENEMEVDFSGLPIHSVIVKETSIKGDGVGFIGAYRYDGYSLYDIIDRGNEDGAGRFSLFPGCDFFSDRAIKSIMEINILVP